MTSTSSAAEPGLPSNRRGFIASLAAAGLLTGTAAVPALAGPPGPIEAMWPEYLRLEAAVDEAGTRAMDAEERYEEPARPGWQPIHTEGGHTIIQTRPGYGTAVLDDGDENIAYLKDCIAREFEPDDPNLGYRNKIRARRARKTLAAIEDWHAEVRRRKNRAGLTKAEAAEQAAGAARRAHVDAIFATEAITFRELAFKAAILDIDWDQEAAERVLERLVELTGVTPPPFGRL